MFGSGPRFLDDLSQDERSRLFSHITDQLKVLEVPSETGPFVYAWMAESVLLQQIRNDARYKLWESKIFNQAMRALKLDQKIVDGLQGNKRFWKRLP